MIYQQIQISGDSLSADAQRVSQNCMIQDRALRCGEHRPKPSQSFCRDARAQSGYIPLQIGLNKSGPPSKTGGVILREVAIWEPSTYPERLNGPVSNLFC